LLGAGVTRLPKLETLQQKPGGSEGQKKEVEIRKKKKEHTAAIIIKEHVFISRQDSNLRGSEGMDSRGRKYLNCPCAEKETLSVDWRVV